MTEQNSSQLYHYPLSSPLPFQAGDVLGCSQPPLLSSQLILRYEFEGRGCQLGYYLYPRTNLLSVGLVVTSFNYWLMQSTGERCELLTLWFDHVPQTLQVVGVVS